MWPFKKKFSKDAIAYVKPLLPNKGSAVVLSHADSPVFKTYTPELLVGYVVDGGSAYQYVQNSHLAEDGVSEAELHEIGLRNLTRLMGKRKARAEAHEDIFAFFMSGDFEASVVLLDDLWDSHFHQFVPGDYAVAIPARDVLAFCDSKSRTGIAQLQQVIARVYASGDHLLTNRIYLRRKGEWKLFDNH